MENKTKMLVSKNTSEAFQVAKFVSILVVVLDHYTKFANIANIWTLSTIGLLIFAYSSGFFTYLKYHGEYSKKDFYLNKLKRLGINLFVVNFFLLILLLFQGNQDIWTWHTVINWLGLNGLLNWFYIPNQSPFGKGMWFFTLLLFFYLLYPIIEKINKTKTLSFSFTILFIVLAFFLDLHIHYNHGLWITACGFVIGVVCAKNKISMPMIWCIGCIAVLIVLEGFCFFVFHQKISSFIFLLLISFFLILIIQQVKPMPIFNKIISPFSDSILEIYLIHGYLFIHISKIETINIFFSLSLTLIAAKLLQFISLIINKKLWIKKII